MVASRVARSTLPSYHPSQLRVTLNGGLEGLPALRAAAATPGLDGLMCGRCAPRQPPHFYLSRALARALARVLAQP